MELLHYLTVPKMGIALRMDMWSTQTACISESQWRYLLPLFREILSRCRVVLREHVLETDLAGERIQDFVGFVASGSISYSDFNAMVPSEA